MLRWAKAHDHDFVLYEDLGVSGAKGRDARPEFDRMLKDAVRGKLDYVAAWSIDRLGRDLRQLLETLAEIDASPASLYLHRQAVDTGTPAGRAMFQMLGVFAEFERSMTRERIQAGMNRAKREGKRIGRKPMTDAEREKRAARVREFDGLSVRKAALAAGVSTRTVQEIRKEAQI